MKRFAMAIALSCVLSGSALAGEIPMVPAPPPNGPSGIATQQPPGDIPTVPGDIPISDAWSTLLSVLGFLTV